MSIAFYMDVHIRRAVSRGLRSRGVDVLTAQDDGVDRLGDPELLDRATTLGRVLVTHDEDLLEESGRCQQSGKHFAGLVYGHQLELTVGQMVRDLELIDKVYDPMDMLDRIEYLPF